MAEGWTFWRRKPALVRQLLAAHMGGPCDDAETISHVIRPIERINLQMALDRWMARDPGGRLVGYNRETFYSNPGISQLLQDDITQAPVQRQGVACDAERELDCVMRGLYLLHHDGQPVALLLSQPESRYDPPTAELLARDRAVAREAMQQLLDEVRREPVYKGKTIYLADDEGTGQVQVRFHHLQPVGRDALILPDELLAVVERNVIGLSRHGETLRRAGRSTRHGLLLHGPPGTGKTLLLRYLAGRCADHTVLVLTGRQVRLIRESCQVARLLAPSLVILEDVDLIGEDRADNRCPVLLQDLLDEMDGLGPKAEVVFLLTTNRPEVLEPALSARPGRIDQAVELPLPDEACRRRLFVLYGKGLDLAAVELSRWIHKTQGASPAFIEELLRKAALLAAERGETADPLPITDDDLAQAMNELVCFGGELTQKLLGFKPFGFTRGN